MSKYNQQNSEYYLCKYKNILGEPGKGVHSSRLIIAGESFALNDIIMTIILAIFISITFDVNFIKSLTGVVVLGIVLHWLFCVETTSAILLENIFN